ncbi:DUF1707 domain-containing protein [Kribbella sp. NPDC051718]|uniref:DUF1707 SHOCT-like domain-containing protein n=1 Tax=Kribbella sp. NPDC051718 TaxID=3155168 RepID=UPI00343F1C4B
MNEEKPIRIGDQEREEAVSRLGAHYEAGRLSADEHQERVGEALQAKTQADLAALFADLPGESTAGPQQGAEPRGQGVWSGRGGAQYGPPWAGRGPLGRIPLPLLIVLGVVGVLASIACTVLGGHPPFLPLVLLVVGVVIAKKRRQERRA